MKQIQDLNSGLSSAMNSLKVLHKTDNPTIEFYPDQDLSFLSTVSNDDLDIIFNLLSYDIDGKKRITGELLNNEIVKKYYPNHKKYINVIVGEIQKFGANSFATAFRSGGVLYNEILNDVCRKMKIKYPKGIKTENIEEYLLIYAEKRFKEYVNKLSTKEKEKLLNEMHLNDINDFTKCLSTGFFTSTSSIIAGTALEAILGRGMPWLIAGVSSLGFLMGIGAIAYSIGSLAGPAYRVTGPICIAVAMLRRKYQKLDSTSSSGTNSDNQLSAES